MSDPFMRLNKQTLLILLALLLSACNLPVNVPSPQPVAQLESSNNLLVGVPPGATATATPFQPLPITPTYLPTATVIPATETEPPPPTSTPYPEFSEFPGPSQLSYLPIPPPVSRLPQPEGQVNILLLGSDERPEVGGIRTDTMLLLTLNPNDDTASLTSFPRDLYVYIPGWTMERINTAYSHGGFQTTAMTFEYNLGVRPDHFVMINFGSFMSVIDSLEGIDVDVAVGLGDNRDGYGYFYLPPGVTHMSGEMALWYVRSRYTTNDFDRTRRQQEVLRAVFNRLLSLDAIKRAPELYKIYKENVTTDLEFGDVAALVPLAARLADTSRIHQYYIGPTEVSNWMTPTGAMVLLPNTEAILGVMRQALNSP